MTGNRYSADRIDTTAPHSARMYDYWLGGKTHYEADAEAAEAVMALWPGVRTGAQVNRWFMRRAARWLAEEAGIRQFLDVGAGIPTTPNLHQVTQAVAPDCRVVYADNDPIVLTYSEALLESSPEGRTVYVHADVTDPASILATPALRETLDLTRPVGLSMMALLHFVTDEGKPYDLVRELMGALPSGSYLMLSHCTPELDPPAWERLSQLAASRSDITGQARSHAEVSRFFDGLELVEPGVVVPHRWRPDGDESVADLTDAEVSLYAGVARKP
ncbi:SAM-dependent methyltransferase [Streptomyces sp. RKND-216]|uniref:SAM-dependent methyltransferase n=1 Tax=Streptomyces sp. RKND-216 TaxID=2562581 RepID=UPI00109D9D60|nr:SAM-dependent methyltransferase [Streptomyces sp. RKND-216]THA23798.1 SAM-dependent methyltransferase [Streptomyces sp. RKND-216]